MSLELELAGRIENPYWDIVKGLPGDELSLKYDNKWEPRSYPPIPSEWTDETRAEYERYSNSGPTRHNLVKRYSWAIPSPETIGWIVEKLQGRKVVEIGAGTGYWAWLLLQSGVDVNAYDLKPPSGGWNPYHCEREDREYVYTQEDRDKHRADYDRWRNLADGITALSEEGDMVPMPAYPKYKPLPEKGVRSVLTGEPGSEWFPVVEAGIEALDLPENEGRVLFLSWPPYDDEMGFKCLSAYQGDTLILIGEPEGGCTGDDQMFKLLNDEWEHLDTGPLVQWWGIHDYIELYVRRS